MPHLTHKCTCGKTIHWPKTRKIGDKWKCRKCGQVSVLATTGEEGKIAPSRKTAAARNKDYISANPPPPSRPSAPARTPAKAPTPTKASASPGCFIATVCCGSADHPTVATLRRLRDHCLRHYKLGRLFIAWYEKFGPSIAVSIGRRDRRRRACARVLSIVAAMLQAGLGPEQDCHE